MLPVLVLDDSKVSDLCDHVNIALALAIHQEDIVRLQVPVT
jgi:hypothetical protein